MKVRELVLALLEMEPESEVVLVDPNFDFDPLTISDVSSRFNDSSVTYLVSEDIG